MGSPFTYTLFCSVPWLLHTSKKRPATTCPLIVREVPWAAAWWEAAGRIDTHIAATTPRYTARRPTPRLVLYILSSYLTWYATNRSIGVTKVGEHVVRTR